MRVLLLSAAIGLALAAVGCGGGSSSSATTASSTAGTTTPHSVQTPIQNRGIKGENPAAEAATTLRLSARDCKALGQLAEDRLGRKLARNSVPEPPLSRCRLDGHGTSINVYLDTGFAANQRYHNRIEETVQFNYEDQGGVPHPVPHVGEKSAYNSSANWIPNLRSLLAVRGNRWLTVTISVDGESGEELRAEAAVLARAGFKLSAVG